MDLKKTLDESFTMLKTHPKIVLPRLLTTILYTILTLYLLNASLIVKQPEITAVQAQEFMVQIIVFIIASIFLYLLDIYTYAMYPQIAKDYHESGQVSLIKAFMKVFEKIKTILAFSILLFTLIGVSSLLFSISATLIIALGQTILLALLLIIFFTAILAVAILFFFIIPVAVIDDVGLKTAFTKGLRLSAKNKKPLFKLNIIFFLLLLMTSAILYLTEFEGTIAIATIITFILARIVQAVIYTYICIANPIAYLSLKPASIKE